MKDQIGRIVELNKTPKRIITLVPSQTELLFDLGLDKEVVGITKFCIHPQEWFRNKKRVGGTKQLNLELIRSLKPDLIIANKEENNQVQLEILMNEFPVWISDIATLADAYWMIEQIGLITNRSEKAASIISGISNQFVKIKTTSTASAAYLIWQEPMMTIGGDTFINEMMKYAGFINVFSNYKRYPEIIEADIKKLNPEFILLSSEPFPFKEKHFEQYRIICPQSKVVLVDGEMFSWYGSRLLKAPSYFTSLRKNL